MRLTASLLLVLAASCSGVAPTTAVIDTTIALEGPTVIELQPKALPIIEIDLGDRQGLPFLVDCGAVYSIIDLPQAEELGLPIRPYSHGSSTIGSGGGSVEYDSFAAVAHLRAGDLILDGSRLPAIDVELLRDQGLVGILGQDLLARLVVLIDMSRGELHLLPTGTDSEAIAAYLADAGIGEGTWVQIPIDFRPRPFVPLNIEGLEDGALEMEIDTGAMTTSLPRAAIEALGLVSTGTTTSRGIDGVYEDETYDLEDFGLYGFLVSTQVKRSALEYGLLGMDVLGEFVLVLDGPNGMVWLHHREIEPHRGGAGDESEED